MSWSISATSAQMYCSQTRRWFSTATGPVDYALFVDRVPCGVIEAKPEGTTLSGFSEQAARYMGSVPEHLVRQEGQGPL